MVLTTVCFWCLTLQYFSSDYFLLLICNPSFSFKLISHFRHHFASLPRLRSLLMCALSSSRFPILILSNSPVIIVL
jgi:hypothetical protein